MPARRIPSVVCFLNRPAKRKHAIQQIERIPPSMAHISLYVGLKSTSEELGICPTNLWICPGPDHDANVSRSEASCDGPLPVLFISFPSAKDPSFSSRYPGRATDRSSRAGSVRLV